MDDVFELAKMIYGEVGSLDYDTMHRAGSTAINRLASGRTEEFGSTLLEVLYKKNAYYAVQNQNDPWGWANDGDFPNEDEENRFKQAQSIAYGLVRGSLQPLEGMFFHTDKEIEKFKKNPRIFNLKRVKKVFKDDKYTWSSY